MSEISLPLSSPGPDPAPQVEALLLAAGRGERLRPLTGVVPKAAIPLPGAPLGAWMLERLRGRFGSVAVNSSHLAPLVISQLALEGRAEVLREEPEPFGTGGTVAALRNRVAGRLVVANADVLTDLDLTALLDAHRASGAPATVAVEKVGSEADFTLSDDGRIGGFVDRRSRTDTSGVRFIGIAVYERSTLDRLPTTRPLGLGEALLGPLAEEGELGALVHDGYVNDVGTLRRYVASCTDVSIGTAPAPPAGPYAEHEGEFVAVEGGAAFVSATADCDRGSLRSGAAVLAHARVPRSARIGKAVVWTGETVPEDADLHDAVWFAGRALTLN